VPAVSTYEHEEGNSGKGGLRNAEDVARLVWKLFSTAGETVDEMMGTEDEVKLLRLRTKRNELVIVPGEWRVRPWEYSVASYFPR